MMTKTTVAILFVLLCIPGWSQTGSLPRKASSNSAVKTRGGASHRLSHFSSENRFVLPEPALQDVLIATNDDCLFVVNEEVKGVALKDAFLYLKLPPGTYRYSAKKPRYR